MVITLLVVGGEIDKDQIQEAIWKAGGIPTEVHPEDGETWGEIVQRLKLFDPQRPAVCPVCGNKTQVGEMCGPCGVAAGWPPNPRPEAFDWPGGKS